MDDFLDKPDLVLQQLRDGMTKAVQGGEITEQEMQSLIDATDPKDAPNQPRKKAGRPPKQTAALRGEGGSGNAKPVPTPVATRRSSRLATPSVTDPTSPTPSIPLAVNAGPSKSKKKAEITPGTPSPGSEKGLHPLEPDDSFMGGDLDAQAGDRYINRSVQPTSEGSVGKESDFDQFRQFVEERFRVLGGLVTSLRDRVVELESQHRVKDPHSAPLTLPSKKRTGVEADLDPTPEPAPKRLVINKDPIRKFIQQNPVPTSFEATRRSKFSLLQTQMGLTPKVVAPTVSEWTVEGLYSLLTKNHAA